MTIPRPPIFLAGVLVAFLGATSLGQENAPKNGKSPSLFPAGYLGHEALSAAIRKAVEAKPERLGLSTLGKSSQGRELWLVTVGKPDRHKPAVLVAANLEGDHVVGSQTILRVIERLSAAEGPTAAWLDRVTLYLVPRLNPDGAERSLGLVPDRPLSAFRGNARPIDRDRDGKAGEDPFDDLDGDRLITTIRHKNAAEGPLTLIPDPADPRILRKADPARGEIGVFAEEPEGRDDDRDGLRNEDPDSGVNLARNWPHEWTEFDRETGFSPASEPEVHALIRFLFDHPEIAAVHALGLHDNLREEPKKPETTLDEADLPYFVELFKVYQKATARPIPAGKGASAPDVGSDGSLGEWAYHQFGVIGLSSRPWSAPDLPAPSRPTAETTTKDQAKVQEKEQEKEKKTEPAKAETPPQPAIPEEGDARWLYWNDQVMGGRAFVPFKAFDHPDLGPVEIGGWKPGVRLNPPIEAVETIAEGILSFLADLAGKMPRLAVPPLKVQAKGGGLFAVTAVVENQGYLPTALARGVKTRNAPPVVVRLDPGGATILAGRPLELIDSLPGAGGRREFRWLLLVPDAGAKPRLVVACPKAGRVETLVPLD